MLLLCISQGRTISIADQPEGLVALQSPWRGSRCVVSDASGGDSGTLLILKNGNISREERVEREQVGCVEALRSIRDRFQKERDGLKYGGAAWARAQWEADRWDQRAWNLERCSTSQVFRLRCEKGHGFSYRAVRCGYQFCGHCHGSRQAEKRDSILDKLSRWRSPWPRMATLTVRNRPVGQLGAMVDELERCFDELRKTQAWRSAVDGAVAVVEVTASAEKGWHAHLHVLWDGALIDHESLTREWRRITGDPFARPHLKAFRANSNTSQQAKLVAAGYVASYASKGIEVRKFDEQGVMLKDESGRKVAGSLLDLPKEMLEEWLVEFFGRRTIRAYGIHLGKPETWEEDRKPWDGVLRCWCGCVAVADAQRDACLAFIDDNRRYIAGLAQKRRDRRRSLERQAGLAALPF